MNDMSLFNDKVLYHGSKHGIVLPVKPKSRDKCDFGTGFYTSDRVVQPQELICDHTDSKLYKVTVDLSALNVYKFTDFRLWALFIAYNRGFIPKYSERVVKLFPESLMNADIIVGQIADDRMFKVMDLFFRNLITDKVLIESLKCVNLGLQYVFKTSAACDSIQDLEELNFDNFMRTKAKNNQHARGIAIGDDLVRLKLRYQREGKFFTGLMEDKV